MGIRKIPAVTEWSCDGCALTMNGESRPDRWATVKKDRHWDYSPDCQTWILCQNCADTFEAQMKSSVARKP